MNQSLPGLSVVAAMLGLVLALAVPSGAQQEPAPHRLRVMTYNIHHGVDVDGQLDLERIARVINDARPDVVLLQEVDIRTERAQRIDEAARLGELTGMEAWFGRALDHQGGHYGQAILSRLPMSDQQVHRLPKLRENLEQRIAISATVDLGAKQQITVIGTHLDAIADEAGRVMQVQELNRLFAGDGSGPALLTGDFNALPDTRPIAILEERWQNATAGTQTLTSPAHEPVRQLDYLFYRPTDRWQVLSATVINEPVASDHRPLLVELELRGTSPPAP